MSGIFKCKLRFVTVWLAGGGGADCRVASRGNTAGDSQPERGAVSRRLSDGASDPGRSVRHA